MSLADVSRQLAKLFISAGADPDAVNKEGRTPIMVAILQVHMHGFTVFTTYYLIVCLVRYAGCG